MKKTFTKHILLLALMVFGVAGAAWASRAPQKFTGPVDITTLVQGDTLAQGFELTGDDYAFFNFKGRRAKVNGEILVYQSGYVRYMIDGYGPNGAINIAQNVYTPVLEDQTTDGNAWVVTDVEPGNQLEVTVGGIRITPDPTVPALDELTGNWNFLMPGANKVVKVTYKALPALAWTFGGRAIPNDTTLNTYLGFHLPVIAQIGNTADADFIAAPGVTLRYGSTNPAVISFTDPNDMWSFSVNGAGECDVYMVFDGNDDFQYDSVAFHAVIANPATLTLEANDYNMGTVSALIGGGSATWTTETWANLPTDQNLSPLTFGDITISTTGSMAINSSYNPGKLSFFVSQFDDAKTLTFSSEGGNFSRIEMTMISEYSQYNPSIIPADGWTFDGYTAVWEGDAPSVTVTSCSTYVSQITFTRGIDSIVATATEGQYLVIPGATVQVVATAVDGSHVSAWSGIDKAVTNLLSDTATFTVGETMTLTATFAQNPLLTLEANNSAWGSVTIESMGSGAGSQATTWDNQTWANMSTEDMQHSFTVGDITLAVNPDWNYFGKSTSSGEPLFIFVQQGENSNLTFTSAGAPFTRIELVMTDAYSEYNPHIQPLDGWSFDGYYATWEGKAQSVSMTQCTTTVDQINFYRAASTVTQLTDNTYRVLPGTEVTVVATPTDTTYLVNFDNDEALNSNVAAEKTLTMGFNDTTLTANFAAKPTLTLAHNDGGEMEIVPAGGVTAMHLTTDQIPTWSGVAEPAMEADLQPFGFVAVDSAAAAAWTGAPASGDAILLYAPAGDKFKAHVFRDGQWSEAYTADYFKGNIYLFSDLIYFTTGASTANAFASATPNVYYVNAGTEVTVVATPSDTTYLVNFDNDEAINSNVAAEKTYTVTENTTATANFSLKPTLTLAHNDGGEMEIPTGLVATDPTPAPTPTAVANPVITCVLMPDGSMQVTMSCATPDADIYYTTDNVTSPLCDCPAAPEYTHPITFTEPVTIMAAAYTGNDWSAVVTKTISLDLPAGVEQLTENTYRVDYGADVTVLATPSDTTYLVNFDNDEAINSNVAAEKTYTVTENTTATAYFAAKPTLTLAANDDTWGSVTVEGAGSAGGEVTIGDGTSTTSVTPYNSLWEYSFVESLYTAEEIGTAGTITSVSYHLREADGPQTSNFVIYMKNVSRSTFASETDYEPVTDADIVYSGSVTFNPGWTTITLGTPFEYDGTSNLMIAFDENTPGFITRYFYYTDNAGKVVTYHSDIDNPDPYNLGSLNGNSYVSSNRANIKLDITAAGSGLSAGVEQLTENTYRVDYGAELVVKAVPESRCFDFTEWSDGTEVNEYLTDTLTITEDYSLTATFVRHDYVGDTTASVCDQFTWHDSTYTVTPETAPTFLYYTTDECDSTVTLNLTIRHQNTGIDNQNVCDSLQWIDGLTYYEANDTAVFTLEGANIEGCDSVVTLNLIIRHSDTSSFRAQANVSYEWLNETFTADGVYTRVLTNTAGCDSTVTMTLSIMPPTTPIPNIYSLMDVMLMINHNPDSLDNFVEYVWYRWYRNGVLVKEGADADSYDEAGQILDGCYYLEVCTDLTQNYWVRSNELCFGTEGIADVERVNFRIAPNPANRGQRVVVAVEGAEGNLQGAHLAIFDAQGRMIANTEFNSSTVELSQSQFSTGIYMLRLTLRDGRTATRRLVVR